MYFFYFAIALLSPLIQAQIPARCLQPVSSGSGYYGVVRYAYDKNTGRCGYFPYFGEGGNDNRFETLEECRQVCEQNVQQPPSGIPDTMPDRCRQPQDPGNCAAYIPQYSFDATTGKCVQFVYGGCGGNENRFETLAECEATCTTDGNLQGPGPGQDLSVPPLCTLPHDRGNCMAYMPQYAFDVKAGKCVQFVYGGCGGNANRFETLAECQTVCEGGNQLGSSGPSGGLPDFCREPKDQGPCMAYMPQYYFDATTGKCVQFVYGGCGGNANRFNSKEECEQACSPQLSATVEPPIPEICHLPTDPGNCAAYIPQYSFNANSGKCVPFVYGGCGGNANRFETLAQCEAMCSPEGNLQGPGPGEGPIQRIPPRCLEPAPGGLCSGFYTTRYTYDQNTQECRPFYYGGCDVTKNHFKTKRECEVVCKEGVSPRAG